ncbi:MAG: tRNA dihydrouridine synthase DusB [Gammaproteobacteria bacterium]
MNIGPYPLKNNLVLAPMAGITDRPFRELCRQFGVGLAVSEMVTSNPALQTHRRTLLKIDHCGEASPRAVQILGGDPIRMAAAARFNVRRGAEIIDINMGCPAKKVCSVAAGSALLKNESLVKAILENVVDAVDVPVTLKIRTGWDMSSRNAPKIAQIAEQAGIAALTIHGRTRACGFSGSAEYATIREVKNNISIPIIANGDIDSPLKARKVLDFTGADAIMIGRAAQGYPWIFNDIVHFLQHGDLPTPLSLIQIREIVLTHLTKLYSFYGKETGVRIARKHIGWYCDRIGQLHDALKNKLFHADEPARQIALVNDAFAFFNTADTA